MSEKPRTRSPSKADQDPDIIAIKQLRDSIADKEKAGEACAGMYRCQKTADKKCLEGIKTKLLKLKASAATGGGKKKRTKSKSRGRSRSRSRGKK
jgi:hypothetical protein